MRRSLLLLCCLAARAFGEAGATIGPGLFTPTLPPGAKQFTVRIEAYRLDRRPVTNAEFAHFVGRHPEWRRDRAASLFTDDDYLSQWSSVSGGPRDEDANRPVTRVSWYAARAYCESRSARLPTWYEWEFAAAADEHRPDARQDPAWRGQILAWYATPGGHPLAEVGRQPANVYGVQDLHGLVWEWVEDFNGLLLSGTGRGDQDSANFCGAGAGDARDREAYPVLMRIAFLSALEARSTSRQLGFRCATDSVP